MRKRQSALVISLILVIVMAAAAVIVQSQMSPEETESSSRTSDTTVTSEVPADNTKPQETATAETEPTATLFFASDYQQQIGWPAPRESLQGILQALKKDGKKPGETVYLGDYTNERGRSNYDLSPEDSIAEIRETMQQEFPDLKTEDMLFIQGNHDRLTESIADSGLHEYGDYLIYVVNAQNDYPWSQGKTSGSLKKVRRTAKNMKKCFNKLIAAGESRPVFVAAHVPLHFSARTSSRHATGDNIYASLLFDVINEAGQSLDIIYFHGHNHSKGWDCYMGGGCSYKAVGDTLLVPAFTKKDVTTDRFTEETLTFTYLNGGYTGYYMNCGLDEIDNGTADKYHTGDETLTGTVCEIYPDRLVLTRYDAKGIHPLGANGKANPYRDYIDTGLIISKYFNTRVDSPQEVERK